MGTPEQSLRLVLDTGSSDLWCNTANSTLCSSHQDACSASGTYDPTSSTTYSLVSSDFNISYADTSGASGDYVSDTLHIGHAAIADFQFGVGYWSSSSGKCLLIVKPRRVSSVLTCAQRVSLVLDTLPTKFKSAAMVDLPTPIYPRRWFKRG